MNQIHCISTDFPCIHRLPLYPPMADRVHGQLWIISYARELVQQKREKEELRRSLWVNKQKRSSRERSHKVLVGTRMATAASQNSTRDIWIEILIIIIVQFRVFHTAIPISAAQPLSSPYLPALVYYDSIVTSIWLFPCLLLKDTILLLFRNWQTHTSQTNCARAVNCL